MKHTITTEQLDALESEYMTRDSISIIANEVRTTTQTENKDLKTAVKMLRKMFDYNCVLYDLAGTRGYCSDKCPLYDNPDASCTPRVFLHKFGHAWEDTP